MQRFIVVVGLALLAAPLSGQRGQNLWRTEVGIRGGYSWFQIAGSGKGGRYDLVDLPGGDLLNLATTYGTMYAVLPWRDKIAFEPSLTVYQATPALTQATSVSIGLRGDYAINPSIYGAVGGILSYVEAGGSNERQLGLQAAVGFRHHLTGPLNGRVEVQTITMKEASNAPPYNVWSLLFGISTGTRAGGARRANAPQPAWPLAIGLVGGYSHNHFNGGSAPDFSTFAFPGVGTSGIGGISAGGPGPATMFVTVPLGAKAAIETGWDFHRIKAYSTNATIFVGQIAPRLNYALNDHWYGALGGSFHMIKAASAGVALMLQSGAQAGVGYRFPLIGDVGGRVEMNYAIYKKRNGVSIYGNDLSTFSVLLGASMGLK